MSKIVEAGVMEKVNWKTGDGGQLDIWHQAIRSGSVDNDKIWVMGMGVVDWGGAEMITELIIGGDVRHWEATVLNGPSMQM